MIKLDCMYQLYMLPLDPAKTPWLSWVLQPITSYASSDFKACICAACCSSPAAGSLARPSVMLQPAVLQPQLPAADPAGCSTCVSVACSPPAPDTCCWSCWMLHLCFCCLQSSSPSYLLMASLDAARAQAQLPGAWEGPLQAARQIRSALCAHSEHVTILDSGESLRCMVAHSFMGGSVHLCAHAVTSR